jgi:small subunit ribosomal protein S18
MAKKASSRNTRGKDANPRKYKKKTSPLLIEKVEYVDYKDVDLLGRFMSDRAKIRNMRVSGNNRQQQLEVANAIKIAREMALLPYAKRVASSSRQRPSRDGDRDRRPPRDGDAPREAPEDPTLKVEDTTVGAGDSDRTDVVESIDGDSVTADVADAVAESES